jgi:hypothetical protein
MHHVVQMSSPQQNGGGLKGVRAHPGSEVWLQPPSEARGHLQHPGYVPSTVSLSLSFALCSLLSDLCSLLSALCSLLSAFCFLLLSARSFYLHWKPAAIFSIQGTRWSDERVYITRLSLCPLPPPPPPDLQPFLPTLFAARDVNQCHGYRPTALCRN